MDIFERMQETVTRLFGPMARLGGAMGLGVGPGCVEIWINGVTVGSGQTL